MKTPKNRKERKKKRTFGAFIRTHRIAKGLSRDELSERSKSTGYLSTRTIQSIENNETRDPKLSTVQHLLAALDIPFNSLSTFFDYSRRS